MNHFSQLAVFACLPFLASLNANLGSNAGTNPAKLKLFANDAALDNFGRSVSVGTLGTIAGAELDDDQAFGAGAAYLFKTVHAVGSR